MNEKIKKYILLILIFKVPWRSPLWNDAFPFKHLPLKLISFSELQSNLFNNSFIKEHLLSDFFFSDLTPFNVNYYNTPYYFLLKPFFNFAYYKNMSAEMEIGILPFRTILHFEDESKVYPTVNKYPLSLEDELWYDEFLNNQTINFLSFSDQIVLNSFEFLDDEEQYSDPHPLIGYENDIYLKSTYLTDTEYLAVYNPVKEFETHSPTYWFTPYRIKLNQFDANSNIPSKKKEFKEWNDFFKKFYLIEESVEIRLNIYRGRWTYLSLDETLHQHIVLDFGLKKNLWIAFGPVLKQMLSYYEYCFIYKNLLIKNFKNFNPKIFEKNWKRLMEKKKLPKKPKIRETFEEHLWFLIKKKTNFKEDQFKFKNQSDFKKFLAVFDFKIKSTVVDENLIFYLLNNFLLYYYDNKKYFTKIILEYKFSKNLYFKHLYNNILNDDNTNLISENFEKAPLDNPLHFFIKINRRLFEYQSLLIPSPYINAIEYFNYMNLQMINKPHCYKYWIFYEEENINAVYLSLNPFLNLFYDVPEEFQYGFQDPASPIMEGIIDLHHDLIFFLILISISIFIILINLVYFNLSKKWIRFINFKYNKWNYHLPNIIFLLNLPFKIFTYFNISKSAFILKNSKYFSQINLISIQNGVSSWYSNYYLNSNWILNNLQIFNISSLIFFIQTFIFNLIKIKELFFIIKNAILIKKIQIQIAKNKFAPIFATTFKILDSGVSDQTESFAFITPEAQNKILQIEKTSQKENIWFPNLFSHHTAVEVIWTLIPAFILIMIALPSFSLLFSMDQIWQPSFTIKVIGNQWYWSYEYC